MMDATEDDYYDHINDINHSDYGGNSHGHDDDDTINRFDGDADGGNRTNMSGDNGVVMSRQLPKLVYGEEDSNGDNQPERFNLGEDVYSLIFISPVCSFAFLFAVYMILLKLILFTFLAIDLYEQSSGAFDEKSTLIRATQFFLLPVAIALQEDLIHVYTRIANIRYDPAIQKISPAATESKFALSFLLRFLDGLYSLIINFVLVLITGQVLSIFLNFAALGFLQSIDDIAFHLAANGYLGDDMEDLCVIVKTSSLPRRVGDTFTNALDSLLFMTTFLVMLIIYVYVVMQDMKDDSS
eukprot:CAMPEP_0119564178 /NCGR_PEP_ID=MMETSP1352-20130426/26123_1 /TAXON_ID=265584 /ORGANISM="Stauroneis constricta, Strain CCMP1120" /LENGTH=296 /DNA_ID=CAMNT_0007612907 /DNA_START=233 /DNA_END=1123 /DNA_ORIENTATION=-